MKKSYLSRALALVLVALGLCLAPFGKTYAQCAAGAAMLAPSASTVALDNGSATISASATQSAAIPAGYTQLYVLTMGDRLVVRGFSPTPSFQVSAAGTYRIHSLVADVGPAAGKLNTSLLIPGVTTASQVLALINQLNLCASLDPVGAQITVTGGGAACTAMAAMLTPDASMVQLGTNGRATISASVGTAATVPSGFSSLYVLTMGDNLVIKGLSETPSFEVDMAGTYRIHSLVAPTNSSASQKILNLRDVVLGTTRAQDVLFLINNLGICASLDPAGARVMVTPNAPTCNNEAGAITFADGSTTQTITAGDGIPDPLAVVQTSTTVGSNFVFLITETDGTILKLDFGTGPFDLEGAGTGTCLIWYLAYEDGIVNASPGKNANNLMGCFDLSNSLSVIRQAPTGQNNGVVTGDISTPGGLNRVDVCSGSNGSTVTAQLNYATPVGMVAYVLTDKDFNILEIQDSPTFDFSDDAAGQYHIWAFNYTGTITAVVGESVFSTRFSTMDWKISQNCIIVNVGSGCVMGGSITFADGSTTQDVCIVEGQGGEVSVAQTGMPVGANQTYLITDANGVILGIPPGNGPFNLSAAGPGTCLIWYLSYNGPITGLSVGNNAANLMGTFSLSNSISAVRSSVNGGAITFADGSTTKTITAGDGIPDPLAVVQTDMTAGSNFVFLITETDGTILKLDFGTGPFDLEGAGTGTCLIWYLAYEDGIVNASPGKNANNLMGCFDLSNALTVVREAPTVNKGLITSPNGNQVSVCQTTGGASTVSVTLNYATPLGKVAYVLTDKDFNILAIQDDATFDFSSMAPGQYHLWAFNYTGDITAQIGDSVFSTRFSTMEWKISQNCIIVNVGTGCVPPCTADAGTVTAASSTATLSGGTATISATADGNAVVPAGYEFAYVLTMGDGLVIKGFNTTGTFSVDMAGTYRIHALVANIDNSPMMNALDLGVIVPGTTTAADVLALVAANNICASLDATGAPIVVADPPSNGGVITGTISPGAGGNTSVCVNSGDPTTVTVTLDYTPTVGSVAYVLTDKDFNILAVQSDATFDFTGRAAGQYHLWSFNYTGTITAAMGESVFSTRFSDGDFLISQNCIIVNVGTGCPTPAPFDFTAAPVSQHELLVRAVGRDDSAPTETQLVDLRITRASGEVVKAIEDLPEAALEAYTVSLDVPTGVYFVSVVRNGEISTQRVVFR